MLAVSMAMMRGVTGPGHHQAFVLLGRRWFSAAQSSTSVTDQMISYALQQAKEEKYDQALDVLRSGLDRQQGVEAARLLLLQGSLEAERCWWRDALDSLSRLHKAVGDSSQQSTTDTGAGAAAQVDPQLLRMAAGRLAVTIHLIQGDDEAAQSACQSSAEATTPDPHTPTRPLPSAAHQAGIALSLYTSLCLNREGSDSVGQGLRKAVEGDEGGAAPQGWAHTAALVTLADWLAAGGGQDDGDGSAARMAAGPLYKSAVEGLDRTPAQDSEFSLLHKELGAAAALGSAQLSIQDLNWDEAEEMLGHALNRAESITSSKHPRIVPALIMLGYVFSRTARVTYAEGLYREAAKILQVDPTTSTDKKPPTSVHPSLVSILGWRFHQLLTVLPNRRREAEAWAGLAQSAWSKSGPVAAFGPLDAALGSADVLTGKGREGAGLLVSLPPRRALPLMTP